MNPLVLKKEGPKGHDLEQAETLARHPKWPVYNIVPKDFNDSPITGQEIYVPKEIFISESPKDWSYAMSRIERDQWFQSDYVRLGKSEYYLTVALAEYILKEFSRISVSPNHQTEEEKASSIEHKSVQSIAFEAARNIGLDNILAEKTIIDFAEEIIKIQCENCDTAIVVKNLEEGLKISETFIDKLYDMIKTYKGDSDELQMDSFVVPEELESKDESEDQTKVESEENESFITEEEVERRLCDALKAIHQHLNGEPYKHNAVFKGSPAGCYIIDFLNYVNKKSWVKDYHKSYDTVLAKHEVPLFLYGFVHYLPNNLIPFDFKYVTEEQRDGYLSNVVGIIAGKLHLPRWQVEQDIMPLLTPQNISLSSLIESITKIINSVNFWRQNE